MRGAALADARRRQPVVVAEVGIRGHLSDLGARDSIPHAEREVLDLLDELVAESGMALRRFEARRRGFEAAARRASALGRPLIVVGDPDAGAHTRLVRAYECGDLCIDLRGCPRCQVMQAVDLPKDITQGPCSAPFVDEVDLPGYHVPGRPDAALLRKTASLMAKSRRPVITRACRGLRRRRRQP